METERKESMNVGVSLIIKIFVLQSSEVSKMAAVTASSNLVSSSSYIHHRSILSYESKAASTGLRSLRQTNTHNGLRILNLVDELLNRTPIQVKAVQARRKGLQGKNVRPTGVIICGMNLIFLGTEVGPWSKTGGLGDVLGGLPPALAVSLLLLFFLSSLIS